MRYQTAGELAAALKAAFEKPVETFSETEPSLNEALRWGRPETPPPVSPAVNVRQPSPNPPMIPIYAQSHSYTGALVPPRRRKTSGLPSWLTWATLAMLIGGLVLAVTLAGVYYALNTNNSPAHTPSENYVATAIFKLTATKEAILQPGAAETESAIDASLMTSTAPPTNTPRSPEDGSPSNE
jgi:hypothetical protein